MNFGILSFGPCTLQSSISLHDDLSSNLNKAKFYSMKRTAAKGRLLFSLPLKCRKSTLKLCWLFKSAIFVSFWSLKGNQLVVDILHVVNIVRTVKLNSILLYMML